MNQGVQKDRPARHDCDADNGEGNQFQVLHEATPW